jgi:1,4-dihydroxy-2-naphthoate octaprenyltransferase
VQGFFTKAQQIRWFLVSGVLATLAGESYGLGVMSINMAKHIDKLEDDKSRGVGTFPVRVGESAARRVDQFAVVVIYVVLAYLVFVTHYFTPVMLVVFFALKEAITLLKVLNKPKPPQAPEGWPAWPAWFSGFAFQHNRQFGAYILIGLIVDALLQVIPITNDLINRYWPPL